jgi:hypothetical protein
MASNASDVDVYLLNTDVNVLRGIVIIIIIIITIIIIIIIYSQFRYKPNVWVADKVQPLSSVISSYSPLHVNVQHCPHLVRSSRRNLYFKSWMS